jgi:hypothetical protein
MEKDRAQEPHQDIQDKEMDESSNPLVMRIIILFDWRMEPSQCFIGHNNFHPKIDWKANHFQFSLVLEG